MGNSVYLNNLPNLSSFKEMEPRSRKSVAACKKLYHCNDNCKEIAVNFAQ